MAPNKISAWSKFSRKSPGPFVATLARRPFVASVATSPRWPNKAIVSVWSPINSLLGFYSPLLALYSYYFLISIICKNGQRDRRNRSCRAVEQDATPASGPFCAYDVVVFQVGGHA